MFACERFVFAQFYKKRNILYCLKNIYLILFLYTFIKCLYKHYDN